MEKDVAFLSVFTTLIRMSISSETYVASSRMPLPRPHGRCYRASAAGQGHVSERAARQGWPTAPQAAASFAVAARTVMATSDPAYPIGRSEVASRIAPCAVSLGAVGQTLSTHHVFNELSLSTWAVGRKNSLHRECACYRPSPHRPGCARLSLTFL